eukprot:SM000146S00958  [mRNA]  locus=s146:101748:103347:- [translate_table: standard]
MSTGSQPPPAASGCSADGSGDGCTVRALQLYQGLIFLTPIVFTFILLILLCVLYIKRRQRFRRRFARSRAISIMVGQAASQQPRSHGLDRAITESFPIMTAAKAPAATVEEPQCPVCLSDYQPSEQLRQLPACRHVFHVECIDAWLEHHTTCPICRTSLLTSKVLDSPRPAAGACPAQEEVDSSQECTSAVGTAQPRQPAEQATQVEQHDGHVVLQVQPEIEGSRSSS